MPEPNPVPFWRVRFRNPETGAITHGPKCKSRDCAIANIFWGSGLLVEAIEGLDGDEVFDEPVIGLTFRIQNKDAVERAHAAARLAHTAAQRGEGVGDLNRTAALAALTPEPTR